MNKLTLFTFHFSLFTFTLMLIGCGGCGGVKSISTKTYEKKVDAEITLQKENEAHSKEIESPPIGVIPPSPPPRMHPDTAAALNKRVMERVRQYTIQPDADTKYFTIDPSTGEVSGCPLIKFAGVYDYKVDSVNNAKEKSKFNKLIPMMEKAWLGTKDTSPSIEFPEGEEHYPRHGYFSANDEYVIVPDGYSHGGTVDRVYFFDRKGKLVNKFMLGKHLESPSFGFNKEKTFFILSNGVGPEYYFFYPDGRVFKKGEFREEGTSYGENNISYSGKYWILRNNLTHIYTDSGLITKLKVGGNTMIDEKNNLLFYTIGSEINILNLLNNKILFKCNHWLPNEIGIFENGKLYFQISKKRLSYETTK